MLEETSAIKKASMSSDIVMASAEADNAIELLVSPWTGILAMATGDDTAAASTLAFHAHQHFAGIATTALQEAVADQQLHFLVLHFGKSWAGLRDAMSLASCFAGAWRREWQHRSESATGVVYGWTAGEEDSNGDELVGRFLRENGSAARSTESVAAKFLEAKYEEKVGVVQKVEEESSWLHGELKELTNIADNIIPEMNHDVHEENDEKLKAELDAMRKEIDTRMERIEELKDGRTKLECRTVHKGALEINSLELENRIRKKEMEAIYAKLIPLEK